MSSAHVQQSDMYSTTTHKISPPPLCLASMGQSVSRQRPPPGRQQSKRQQQHDQEKPRGRLRNSIRASIPRRDGDERRPSRRWNRAFCRPSPSPSPARSLAEENALYADAEEEGDADPGLVDVPVLGPLDDLGAASLLPMLQVPHLAVSPEPQAQAPPPHVQVDEQKMADGDAEKVVDVGLDSGVQEVHVHPPLGHLDEEIQTSVPHASETQLVVPHPQAQMPQVDEKDAPDGDVEEGGADSGVGDMRARALLDDLDEVPRVEEDDAADRDAEEGGDVDADSNVADVRVLASLDDSDDVPQVEDDAADGDSDSSVEGVHFLAPLDDYEVPQVDEEEISHGDAEEGDAEEGGVGSQVEDVHVHPPLDDYEVPKVDDEELSDRETDAEEGGADSGTDDVRARAPLDHLDEVPLVNEEDAADDDADFAIPLANVDDAPQVDEDKVPGGDADSGVEDVCTRASLDNLDDVPRVEEEDAAEEGDTDVESSVESARVHAPRGDFDDAGHGDADEEEDSDADSGVEDAPLDHLDEVPQVDEEEPSGGETDAADEDTDSNVDDVHVHALLDDDEASQVDDENALDEAPEVDEDDAPDGDTEESGAVSSIDSRVEVPRSSPAADAQAATAGSSDVSFTQPAAAFVSGSSISNTFPANTPVHLPPSPSPQEENIRQTAPAPARQTQSSARALNAPQPQVDVPQVEHGQRVHTHTEDVPRAPTPPAGASGTIGASNMLTESPLASLLASWRSSGLDVPRSLPAAEARTPNAGSSDASVALPEAAFVFGRPISHPFSPNTPVHLPPSPPHEENIRQAAPAPARQNRPSAHALNAPQPQVNVPQMEHGQPVHTKDVPRAPTPPAGASGTSGASNMLTESPLARLLASWRSSRLDVPRSLPAADTQTTTQPAAAFASPRSILPSNPSPSLSAHTPVHPRPIRSPSPRISPVRQHLPAPARQVSSPARALHAPQPQLAHGQDVVHTTDVPRAPTPTPPAGANGASAASNMFTTSPPAPVFAVSNSSINIRLDVPHSLPAVETETTTASLLTNSSNVSSALPAAVFTFGRSISPAAAAGFTFGTPTFISPSNSSPSLSANAPVHPPPNPAPREENGRQAAPAPAWQVSPPDCGLHAPEPQVRHGMGVVHTTDVPRTPTLTPPAGANATSGAANMLTTSPPAPVLAGSNSSMNSPCSLPAAEAQNTAASLLTSSFDASFARTAAVFTFGRSISPSNPASSLSANIPLPSPPPREENVRQAPPPVHALHVSRSQIGRGQGVVHTTDVPRAPTPTPPAGASGTSGASNMLAASPPAPALTISNSRLDVTRLLPVAEAQSTTASLLAGSSDALFARAAADFTFATSISNPFSTTTPVHLPPSPSPHQENGESSSSPEFQHSTISAVRQDLVALAQQASLLAHGLYAPQPQVGHGHGVVHTTDIPRAPTPTPPAGAGGTSRASNMFTTSPPAPVLATSNSRLDVPRSLPAAEAQTTTASLFTSPSNASSALPAAVFTFGWSISPSNHVLSLSANTPVDLPLSPPPREENVRQAAPASARQVSPPTRGIHAPRPPAEVPQVRHGQRGMHATDVPRAGANGTSGGANITTISPASVLAISNSRLEVPRSLPAAEPQTTTAWLSASSAETSFAQAIAALTSARSVSPSSPSPSLFANTSPLSPPHEENIRQAAPAPVRQVSPPARGLYPPGPAVEVPQVRLGQRVVPTDVPRVSTPAGASGTSAASNMLAASPVASVVAVSNSRLDVPHSLPAADAQATTGSTFFSSSDAAISPSNPAPSLSANTPLPNPPPREENVRQAAPTPAPQVHPPAHGLHPPGPPAQVPQVRLGQRVVPTTDVPCPPMPPAGARGVSVASSMLTTSSPAPVLAISNSRLDVPRSAPSPPPHQGNVQQAAPPFARQASPPVRRLQAPQPQVELPQVRRGQDVAHTTDVTRTPPATPPAGTNGTSGASNMRTASPATPVLAVSSNSINSRIHVPHSLPACVFPSLFSFPLPPLSRSSRLSFVFLVINFLTVSCHKPQLPPSLSILPMCRLGSPQLP
ncbi:hypothetical protein C8R45DRAFT_1159689 [Mycena sanguinolenta]|nr:hypothetical protein C8R45DRAFT_1159689 [Mycena sanguinolenta]